MSDPEIDEMERQLRRTVERAARNLMRQLEEEPEAIIIAGDSSFQDNEQTIAEITSWLFRRSKENGSSTN
jgi:hypothetical protein